jgi:hypothetical protein
MTRCCAPDRLASVWPAARRLRTVQGDPLDYDALLVAVGAHADMAVPGALTFSGARDVAAMRRLLGDLVARRVHSVAFAVPAGVSWALPLYELALMTAERLRAAGIHGTRLAIVTPEPNPLDVFGTRVAGRIRALLAQRGIGLWVEAVPLRVGDHGLEVAHGDPVAAERVVARCHASADHASTACLTTQTASSQPTSTAPCPAPRRCGRPETERHSRSSRAAWPHNRPMPPPTRSPPTSAPDWCPRRSGPRCAAFCSIPVVRACWTVRPRIRPMPKCGGDRRRSLHSTSRPIWRPPPLSAPIETPKTRSTSPIFS